LFEKLAEPFPPDAISWRVGSTNGDKTKGLALAYLDARDVMDRLDLVCGPAGWQNRYSHVGGVTVCEIGVRTEDQWLWKADGAGASDIEAEKGALSDAFKRAAVRWGIGRYLYSLPSPWVTLVAAGRSQKIADSEYGKLRQLLATHSGISLKSSAAAKRHQDFEYYVGLINAADDLEALGAVGRQIKAEIHMLPAAQREPLQDAYLSHREELLIKEPA
jgi:hypothetical protein